MARLYSVVPHLASSHRVPRQGGGRPSWGSGPTPNSFVGAIPWRFTPPWNHLVLSSPASPPRFSSCGAASIPRLLAYPPTSPPWLMATWAPGEGGLFIGHLKLQLFTSERQALGFDSRVAVVRDKDRVWTSTAKLALPYIDLTYTPPAFSMSLGNTSPGQRAGALHIKACSRPGAR
ncbi:hypothetical protein LZ30DRAFT_396887 [Colletotrichum cereale]|nr:hypothetical protein LZ30DRAFT_396887 [Colletotrichum cereale]